MRVWVTPRASGDALAAIRETAQGPAVGVRVRSVASDGAANRAVIQFVAERLGVPPTLAEIVQGQKSRVKLLHVQCSADTLVRILGDVAARNV